MSLKAAKTHPAKRASTMWLRVRGLWLGASGKAPDEQTPGTVEVKRSLEELISSNSSIKCSEKYHPSPYIERRDRNAKCMNTESLRVSMPGIVVEPVSCCIKEHLVSILGDNDHSPKP